MAPPQGYASERSRRSHLRGAIAAPAGAGSAVPQTAVCGIVDHRGGVPVRHSTMTMRKMPAHAWPEPGWTRHKHRNPSLCASEPLPCHRFGGQPCLVAAVRSSSDWSCISGPSSRRPPCCSCRGTAPAGLARPAPDAQAAEDERMAGIGAVAAPGAGPTMGAGTRIVGQGPLAFGMGDGLGLG